MMEKLLFTEKDFDVFKIDGLDKRMEAIKTTIRPKLEQLGNHFAPYLSVLTGEENYYHVAKHARRTVNPPNDTWVAWSTSKRGYKSLPHFQVGLWSTHLFIWFAVIYEAPNKEKYGKQIINHTDEIMQQIPKQFVWSIDHTRPEGISHQSINEQKLAEMGLRLSQVKKSELLCGLHIDRNDPILNNPEQLINTIESTFSQLIPLYKLSRV